jgi:sugar (pentulose or hexulose) kinase
VNRRAIVVLDVGKTFSKLSLWTSDGQLIERRSRANNVIPGPRYTELDCAAVEAWLAAVLAEFAGIADVTTIIPVAHGAAAALIADGDLWAGPMDYEDEGGASLRPAYDAQRDPFEATGSPALPQGLNLGMQLHRLEALANGAWPDDLRIVTWPQYWAWRLSGVASVEASSLGCHSDLWRPVEHRYSDLAQQRGWATRMAPLRHASEALGVVSREWRDRTGLPANCQVLCGMHDSNAALFAALGHPELAGADATILSTGTWFVAMRSPASQAHLGVSTLQADRDCLLNVNIDGRPIPSARFMGGREAEVLCGEALGIALASGADAIAEVGQLVSAGIMAMPGNVPGVGPFPNGQGGWVGPAPTSPKARRAAVSLYLALMADAVLDLLESRDRVVVAGRFAEDIVFVRALAALRRDIAVYLSHAQDDVCYGALRLINRDLPPSSPLVRVAPLPLDLDGYRSMWKHRVQQAQPISAT